MLEPGHARLAPHHVCAHGVGAQGLLVRVPWTSVALANAVQAARGVQLIVAAVE